MGPLAGRVLLLSLLVGLSVNLTEDCDEFAPLRGEAVELGGAPGGGLGALGQCLDVALLPPIGHDGSNTGGRKCCGEECFVAVIVSNLTYTEDPEVDAEFSRMEAAVKEA